MERREEKGKGEEMKGGRAGGRGKEKEGVVYHN